MSRQVNYVNEDLSGELGVGNAEAGALSFNHIKRVVR